MIFANGIPKSGTHALMKCLSLLGLKREPGLMRTIWNDHPLRLKATDADKETRGTDILDDPAMKFIHSHVADRYVKYLTDPIHRVIYIIRDPRNVAVSYMRYQVNVDKVWDECSSELLQDVLSAEFYDGGLVSTYDDYWRWLDAPNTLVVKYEDLISDEMVSRDIANFLFIPWRPESFTELQGPSKLYTGKVNRDTWTGKPSSWEDWWTDDVDEVWRDTGGPELLEKLNYA